VIYIITNIDTECYHLQTIKPYHLSNYQLKIRSDTKYTTLNELRLTDRLEQSDNACGKQKLARPNTTEFIHIQNRHHRKSAIKTT
jgi:hypothetical protein